MVCTLSAPKRTAQCCEYQSTNFRNGFWIFAAGAMFELLGWIRVMMHVYDFCSDVSFSNTQCWQYKNAYMYVNECMYVNKKRQRESHIKCSLKILNSLAFPSKQQFLLKLHDLNLRTVTPLTSVASGRFIGEDDFEVYCPIHGQRHTLIGLYSMW